MNYLWPLGFLLLIVLAGFFFHFNFDPTSFKSTTTAITQKIEQKVEATLPPPRRGGGSSSSPPSSNAAITISGIIGTTNAERSANGGLKALKENAKLDAAAAAKVKDMFANQYFEHTSPQGKGPADLAKAEGYSYILIGENLALGNFKDDQDLLTAWMNSPGHRANILNSKFTEMGAAASMGLYEGRKVWLAVQEFGEPLSSCPEVDASLEATIERLKVDLDKKATALEAKKKEIDNASPKSGDAYDQKVADYNQMVAAYNNEVKVIKADVDTYNREVKAFNSCAAV